MAAQLSDGTYEFSLGQDAYHQPDQIQPNQYAKGVNVTTKSGIVSPRNGFHDFPLFFEDTILTEIPYNYPRTVENIWHTGKFQSFIPYVKNAREYLITVISGLIFRTEILTGHTILLSEDITVNQYQARINWSYAADKIVLFDFPNYPVVIDDTDIFRTSPTHEINGQPAPQVPISNLGAYNQNRLFVANIGSDFTASDAVGNLATPEAPITFIEVFTPSTGFTNQSFSLPVGESMYSITAMGFIQQIDTNTGIGPLFVATKKKVYSYNTAQPRANWTQGQFGGLLIANAGIVGPRAFVNVNSDIVFLSDQGKVHAFSSSRNDQKTWGNVPISREVENYLRYYDPSLRQFAVLGYFDNRIFISANPYRAGALDRSQRPISDYAHGGLVVLEIDNMATLLAQGTPVWAGLWTGVDPMDICNIGDRCFIISKDGNTFNGGNAIYELKKNSTFDVVKGRKRPVRSILYTRMYNFVVGEDPGGYLQKRELSLNLHMQDIEGEFHMKIEQRPSHSSEWLDYITWDHTAPVETCCMPEDKDLNGFAAHQFKELIFGDSVQQGCSPIMRDEYSTFRAIQYRFTMEGDFWALNDIKSNAEIWQRLENQDERLCSPLPATRLVEQCDPDFLIPEETLCPPSSM